MILQFRGGQEKHRYRANCYLTHPRTRFGCRPTAMAQTKWHDAFVNLIKLNLTPATGDKYLVFILECTRMACKNAMFPSRLSYELLQPRYCKCHPCCQGSCGWEVCPRSWDALALLMAPSSFMLLIIGNMRKISAVSPRYNSGEKKDLGQLPGDYSDTSRWETLNSKHSSHREHCTLLLLISNVC